MTEPYDDIINLPHHVSRKRPPMPRIDRAAQFSPFAALTGYDEAIKETARLTDEKTLHDEESEAALNMKIKILSDVIDSNPEISVTYFQPDEKKSGGKYVTAVGNLKRIDDYQRIIVMTNGTSISVDEILDIDSKLFQSF